MRKNELVYYYALDRKWMSTDQAAVLLRRAEEAGLIRLENGVFTILFDPATVTIPNGFKPTSAVFEANDPAQELIGRIVKARGVPETEVVAGMKNPSGGNIAVRREVFAAIDGFSTKLGPVGHNLMGGEDAEFIDRARAAGIRILYSPRMRQYHLLEHERMKTLYMMKKSYLRSYSSVSVREHEGIALSILRKLLSHLWHILSSLDGRRRFYWLMRFAATMGELRGQFQPKRN